ISMILVPPNITLFPYTTLFRSGLILDTDKKCYIKTKKIVHLFDVSDKCKPLPKFDYVLMFRTLYAKCEPCSTEDFNNSAVVQLRSEEHTSELQSRENIVCRLLL